jgi:hypothetical protein
VGTARVRLCVSSREQTWLEGAASTPRAGMDGRGGRDVSGSQPGVAVAEKGGISPVDRSLHGSEPLSRVFFFTIVCPLI